MREALINFLAASVSPLTLARARAKVLAREDREMRAELIRIRRELDLTQALVAERMGVSQQAVQKLERYDSDLRLSTLRRYSNAIGAIVEHRVTVDTGQSLALATSSPWEEASTYGQYVPRAPYVQPAGSAAIWSAADANRNEFALSA